MSGSGLAEALPQRRVRHAEAGADGEHWRIARVRSKADLAPLLAAFGVVVIADGLGGFEHNAAIHLLGRDGKLAEISDIEQPAAFIQRIGKWL